MPKDLEVVGEWSEPKNVLGSDDEILSPHIEGRDAIAV
jgi:hypothetical protein